MTFNVVDHLLYPIGANLVIFDSIRARLPFEVEETVVRGCLLPWSIGIRLSIRGDSQIHNLLDYPVIVALFYNEL
jgi:hypothetical protein